jgi:hypothetical protein
MLPPEVEERFRKIEDNLLVTSELQRRGDARLERLEGMVSGLVQWMQNLEGKIEILVDAQIRNEEDKREMRAAIADLARTVDLKARTNGGGN